MKKTLKIAKLELSNLFYSPIAWFLLIIFVFQSSYNFSNSLENLMQTKHLIGKNEIFGSLTSFIYSGTQSSLFPSLLDKLYLYMPLLTMGLISREMSSGTISLLYSSPVKIGEIIFGKFIAMAAYSVLLVSILLIYAVIGLFFLPDMNFGIILSGLLGIFLLLCTYSAIGLFMSCLTNYQVVAALSTFVVFALFTYIGQVWQRIDFVRDITYFLSINGRTTKMVGGLITTKDVFYFLLITALFLSFSIIKLKSGRETMVWYKKAFKYIAITAIVLGMGYVSSRPVFIAYWDVTSTQRNTITESAQKLIKQLNAPLEVTSYINYLDNHHYFLGAPERRNDDLDRWERYIRFKKDIRLKYVYYYDDVPDDPYLHKFNNKGKSLKQIAQRQAEAERIDLRKFIPPTQIRKEINLLPEDNQYVMQLRYKGRTTFLRLFDDPITWPSETEVSAAIKRLISTPPTIGFLEGDYERSLDKPGDEALSTLTNKKSFRYSLVNQGFDMKTIFPDSLHGIPTDIAALVIADPRKPFTPKVQNAIENYIAQGGNLMVLGKPGKQGILNPILQTFGVKLNDGQIIQDSSSYAQNIAVTYLTEKAANWSAALNGLRQDSTIVSMPGLCYLTYQDTAGFACIPLVKTDSTKSWNHIGTVVWDSSAIHFNASSGDTRGSYAAVLALSRKINGKEQRIVVSGDADMMSNVELRRNNMGRTANFALNTELFGWFTYGAFPIDSYRPKPGDKFFTLGDTGLTTVNLLLLWTFPVGLLLFGTILLIRRRRK